MNFNPLFLDKLTISDNAVQGTAAKKGQQSYLFSDIIKLCEEEINSDPEINGNMQQILFPNDSFSIPVNKTTIDDSVLKDILNYIQNYIDNDPAKLSFNSDKYQLDSAVLIKKSFMLSENDIQSFVEGLIDKLHLADTASVDKTDTKEVNEKREKVLMTLLTALPNNESVDLKFKGKEINLTVIFSKTAESENLETQFPFNQIKPLKYFTSTIIEQKVGKNESFSTDSPESKFPGNDTVQSADAAAGNKSIADMIQAEFPFEQKETADSGAESSKTTAGAQTEDAAGVGGNPSDAALTGDLHASVAGSSPESNALSAEEETQIYSQKYASKSPDPKAVDTEKISREFEKTTGIAVESKPSADEMKVFKVEVIETNFGKQQTEEKAPTIIPIDKYPAAETSVKQNAGEPVNILPINKEVEFNTSKESVLSDSANPASGKEDSGKVSAEKPVSDKNTAKEVKIESKIFNIEDASLTKSESKPQNIKYDNTDVQNPVKDAGDLKNLSDRNFNLSSAVSKENENTAQTAPRSETPKTNDSRNDLKNEVNPVKNSADIKVETKNTRDGGSNLSSDFSKEQSKLDSGAAAKNNIPAKNFPDQQTQPEKIDAVKQAKKTGENTKEIEHSENAGSTSEFAKEAPKQQSFEVNKLNPEQKINGPEMASEKVKHFADVKTPETMKVIQAAEIVNEISRFVQKNEKQSMTFQLNPENLGKVQLRVDVQDNKINTYIEVENTQVKQAIQSNIDSLKQTLQNAGMQLNNVNVSLANSEQKFAKPGQFKKKGLSGKAVKVETEKAAARQKNLGYNTYEYLI